MSYSLINNGDSGLSVRTTINSLLTDANDGVFIGATGVSGSSGSSGTSGTSPSGGALSASVQTTSSATASMASLSMGTYSVYSIEATVSAYDSSNALGYGAQMFATFKNNGLSTSQISTTDNYEKSDFLSATSHIILNGSNIDIVAIGETSKTINWFVNYSITKI